MKRETIWRNTPPRKQGIYFEGGFLKIPTVRLVRLVPFYRTYSKEWLIVQVCTIFGIFVGVNLRKDAFVISASAKVWYHNRSNFCFNYGSWILRVSDQGTSCDGLFTLIASYRCWNSSQSRMPTSEEDRFKARARRQRNLGSLRVDHKQLRPHSQLGRNETFVSFDTDGFHSCIIFCKSFSWYLSPPHSHSPLSPFLSLSLLSLPPRHSSSF